MKKLILAGTFLFSFSAIAAVDYSGCMESPLSEGMPQEYQITSNGRLAGAKVKGNKDTLTRKMPSGSGKQTFVLERDSQTGRPEKLTHTYPSKSGKTIMFVRSFAYDKKGRCYVNETVKVDASKKSNTQYVTYYHELCEDLLKWYGANKRKMSNCAKEFDQIGETLGKFDQQFRKNGKELAGYDAKDFAENPFHAGMAAAQSCARVRDNYPYPYTKRWGAFSIGDLDFNGIPYHSDDAQEEREERDAK